MDSGSTFQRRVGGVALAMIILHVLVSLVVLAAPWHVVQSHGFVAMYKRLILLGPFFQESRIKTSPHLYFSYNVSGRWQPLEDPWMKPFQQYRAQPWRYGLLRGNDYERFLTRQIGEQIQGKTFEVVKQSKAFRELNQFVLEEYIHQPIDSLRLTYGVNTFVPDEGFARFDTIFTYTYDPHSIGPAKRP